MVRFNKLFWIVALGISLCGCRNAASDSHLITDDSYRAYVHEQFLKQRAMAAGRDSVLFSVFDRELTQAETEGLEFLYAFMPLSDLAMNDGEYVLKQVKTALEAKSFFKWGADIPNDIFLHFVLPYRVNNEYTDTARQVFFGELKDRLASLDMEAAALEVNHWCHEKVVYKSTDERTSGPLTTVRTAFGRCGEESTFTVSAMRAVGIPARQVYTPRWAHSDDNHAWVEVWVNGKWHFLGACEPEPTLDMGWFAEPAKRAMMTHTFVFGKYNGKEEVIETEDRYARLNLLRNYTDVKQLPVKILDDDGKGVADAKVEFGLYNYAEFYPIATQFTDQSGNCRITTGFGDLLVHVSKNGISSSAWARSTLTDTLKITLGNKTTFLPEGIYTIVVPVRQSVATADPQLVEKNNRRLLQEDSISSLYTATFVDSVATDLPATDLPSDMSGLWKYFVLSRGNWHEINHFVKGLSSDHRNNGLAILANISEKDLHDVQASVLNDHLQALDNFPKASWLSTDYFERYVLSPRIGRELITPWRSFIQNAFSSEQARQFSENPILIRDWIAENIVLDSLNNYYGAALSPEGMLQLGRADNYSRNLLFVAISRSFGIASRLEPSTRRPQFFEGKTWNDVFFGTQSAKSSSPRGILVLHNLSPDMDFIPRYYTHYTFGRYENGAFVTLDYENDASLLKFPTALKVDTGFYRLITGNRLSSGNVVANISYFRVKQDQTTNVDISLSSAHELSGITGKADLNASFITLDTQETVTLKSFFGTQGLVVALFDPSKEPTKHLMEDLRAVKTALDQWGGKVLFVVAREKNSPGFQPKLYYDLPKTAFFGYDAEGKTAAALSTACSIEAIPQWPILMLINPKGEIVWYSEGYNIGLGDQLVKQIKKMAE